MGTGVSPKRIAASNVSSFWQLNNRTIPTDSFPYKGGDPAAPSDTATLLRLHPSQQPRLRQLSPLLVKSLTSGVAGSHGVTGGVYKTRERIHRDILIRDY